MPSNRKRRKRLLRWTRWWAHYPWTSWDDLKVTPACDRARRAVYPPRESYGHAWDGSDNPYAGPYGDLVRAEMERLEWSTWAA